jgi:DNA-binding XRE family transcriptional regulator
MDLKEVRAESKLSQVNFAKTIGVSPSAVAKIEAGGMKASPKIIEAVKNVYGVDIEPEVKAAKSAEKKAAKPAAKKAEPVEIKTEPAEKKAKPAAKKEKTSEKKAAKPAEKKAKATEVKAEPAAKESKPIEIKDEEKSVSAVKTVQPAEKKEEPTPAAENVTPVKSEEVVQLESYVKSLVEPAVKSVKVGLLKWLKSVLTRL